MKGTLSQARIDYVLFHWNMHVQLSGELRSRFLFSPPGVNVVSEVGRIIFPLSDAEHPVSDMLAGDVPVLFPVTHSTLFYELDSRGNLLFSNDVLRGIFWLLSGIQEYDHKGRNDALGRFDFQHSFQFRSGWITRPLVNYYFKIMGEGLKSFCLMHGLEFREKRLFDRFGFFLSHDVDRINSFDFQHVGWSLKELAGRVPSRLTVMSRVRRTLRVLGNYLNLRGDTDPYLSFELMQAEEQKNRFKSTFFFLLPGVQYADAAHQPDHPVLKCLYSDIQKCGGEIGLHGTVRSAQNREIMEANMKQLIWASGVRPAGNRQHRLIWSHPETAIVEEQLGLQYDATLGFAGHEGYRNGYCHPFRLFDFQNDRMMDLWELPLQVMDVTLFNYRRLSFEDAHKAVNRLLDESQRFGGMFSLLWHNSFFDEEALPGITNFYRSILSEIARRQPECLTGREMIHKTIQHV